MRGSVLAWAPAGILTAGALLTAASKTQRSLPLRIPLGMAIPVEIAGYDGHDQSLSSEERHVVGTASYLLRSYGTPDTTRHPPTFSLYIGYYDRQSEGQTIHSPKNCLPGAGWEPLASQTVDIPTAGGSISVNRYLLQHGSDRALVLYWYQGRGRVSSNEYLAKWQLLRDAALRHRSDEALVRIVVPITRDPDSAFRVAAAVARQVIPNLYGALPH